MGIFKVSTGKGHFFVRKPRQQGIRKGGRIALNQKLARVRSIRLIRKPRINQRVEAKFNNGNYSTRQYKIKGRGRKARLVW